MKKRLEHFYSSFGDSGIMFILYAFSVVANCLLTWNMELPAIHPDEITVAGTAAFFAGKDWSALLASPHFSEGLTGGGYIQALFYVPLFYLFNTPYAIYKAMLVVNSLLISFIPMIVYHIAAKLGVARVRHKLMISISCGMYVSYIVSGKYIWGESISALLCWVMLLCVFTAWDKKNKSTRFTMSVLLGFLFAVSYAADFQLLAVNAAILITVLLAHFVLREKVLNLVAFAGSAALSFVAERLVSGMLREKLSGADPTLALSGSIGNFFSSLFSATYSFMTSSLGAGALALALSFVLILSLIREGIRKRVETPESNTKVYEPIKHKYSLRITLFALFQFLAVGCLEIFSSMFVINSGSTITEISRSGDNLAPFALFLVMVFAVQYGMELHQLFLGAGIYGYVCGAFALLSYGKMTDEQNVRVLSDILPLKGIVEVTSSPMTYLILSSCVFTLFALLMVFVSCSRKHRGILTAASLFSVFVLSAGYLSIAYLPKLGRENIERTAPYCEVFALLYNNSQSPPIVIYEAENELAATIQFLAKDTKVSIVKAGEEIPSSCLLVTYNKVQIPKGVTSYDNVGKTDTYTVYAFGEAARNFIKFSSQAEQSEKAVQTVQPVSSTSFTSTTSIQSAQNGKTVLSQ